MKRLLEAVRFYKERGFSYKTVPWAVSADAISITKPKRLALNECPSYSGGYIVASAEQSFLHLRQEARREQVGKEEKDRYVTLTPCFRNEIQYDEIHRPWFFKTELVDWDAGSILDLHNMIDCAVEFFSQFVEVDVV